MAGVPNVDPGLISDPEEIGDAERTSESGRTWLGVAGLLVVVASFVAFGGLPGLLAAAVVAAGWYLLPHTFAFALGQIALVSMFSAAETLPFLVGQAGLLGVLFAPVTAADDSGWGPADGSGWSSADAPDRETLARLGRVVPVAALGLLAGGGAAWASQQTSVGLPTAGLALVAVLGLAAYGLHRYQLVALGLVSDADSASDTDRASDADPASDADSVSDSEPGGDADEQ